MYCNPVLTAQINYKRHNLNWKFLFTWSQSRVCFEKRTQPVRTSSRAFFSKMERVRTGLPKASFSTGISFGAEIYISTILHDASISVKKSWRIGTNGYKTLERVQTLGCGQRTSNVADCFFNVNFAAIGIIQPRCGFRTQRDQPLTLRNPGVKVHRANRCSSRALLNGKQSNTSGIRD